MLVAPLALSPFTSWLALLAHGLLAATCTGLVAVDALGGRPFAARAWGAWFVVATGGAALALQVSSWDRDGWGWGVFVLLASWAWLPPAAAWIGGLVAERRERTLARRAVRRRRARLAADQPSNSVA